MNERGKQRSSQRDSGARNEKAVNDKARTTHGRAMQAGQGGAGGSTGQRSKHDR